MPDLLRRATVVDIVPPLTCLEYYNKNDILSSILYKYSILISLFLRKSYKKLHLCNIIDFYAVNLILTAISKLSIYSYFRGLTALHLYSI